MASKQPRRLELECLERREVPSAAHLTVMSENVYLGDDPLPAAVASGLAGPTAAIPAWTNLWNNVITHLQERAEAIAREIVANKPELIGLQEADRYWSVSLFQNYDFVQILQKDLKAMGVSYKIVNTTTENAFESPGNVQGALQDLHVDDRVAILARQNVLSSGAMKLSHVQGQPFFTQIPIPPSLGINTVKRGWDSVDVAYGGHNFRFLNMCLEIGALPLTQAMQAGELLLGPAAPSKPVILVGDSNTNANDGVYSLTYSLFTVAGGFKDAWLQTNPNDPGYTWGNQPDLRNAVPMMPDKPDPNYKPVRGDLVLYRGHIHATSMKRVGVFAWEKTISGLWPSDHAGVVATLSVG